MNSSWKRFLKPFASLTLTVVLLASAMVVIFAGTWAQKDADTWAVQKQFFHSWYCWIDIKLFLRRPVPGGFPFVGGYFLITALLINLLAAHTVRFKLTWKRAGIILIHLGLIMLLVGEALTSLLASEGQMTLAEGQAMNFKTDIRAVELAVTDSPSTDHETVTVVPERKLTSGKQVQDAKLPFEIQVDDYLPNSRQIGPVEPANGAVLTAEAGQDPLRVLAIPLYTGASSDSEKVNMPSAKVTLTAGGKRLGSYLVSLWSERPPQVRVGEKVYPIELRFKRLYTPYTVQLLKFTHEKYIGTDTAKNFASRIRLIDPPRKVDREVLIWMNHPLRYEGETFYQQGFDPRNSRVTTLQIVRNPSWLMPYAALIIAVVGLVLQFGNQLLTFLERQLRAGASQAIGAAGSLVAFPVMPAKAAGVARSAANGPSPRSMPLLSRSREYGLWDRLIPWGVGITFVIVVISSLRLATMRQQAPYNLTAFGQLPVMAEGRAVPLDTLARTSLKIIRARESALVDGKSVPATQWLLDVLTGNDEHYAVFRIDNQDVLSSIGLDPGEKFFTFSQLLAHKETLQPLMDQAREAQQSGTMKPDDVYQKKMLELMEHLNVYIKLRQFGDLIMVPPLKDGADWQTVSSAVAKKKADPAHAPPALTPLMTMLDDYVHAKPDAFNTTVGEYRGQVEQALGWGQKKVEFEAFFNRFDPFTLCVFSYVVVFLLAVASWLANARPLTRAAFVLLGLTFLLHTFGLLCRIIIQGRPPVTNLYSSAIFIAWGGVALAAVLELIFRNGIGSVAAALIGMASLLIAQGLAISEGDTMKPLQAVLATNFWLSTHVIAITLGYASTFLAGLLAIIYIVLGLCTTALDPAMRKTLSRMTYGIICFALLFSFVGTILGGIWADQSWGRFWGWDPKENGAVLIVLWNAIILHARWGGLVRERGLMILAVFGNVVTSWSWFGTNMLGVGLHAYGFMDAAFPILLGFVASQLVIMGVANIPFNQWRSVAEHARVSGGAGALRGTPAAV